MPLRLDHRIGFLPDIGAQIAVIRLGRRLQALAVDVEQPAMKGATQAAVFEPAISEVGAAMRAMPADQSVAALVILEGDEVFAKKPYRLDRPVAGKLVDQGRRLPVAPHESTGGGPRRGAGDQIVLLRAQHCRPRCTVAAALVVNARRRDGPRPAAARHLSGCAGQRKQSCQCPGSTRTFGPPAASSLRPQPRGCRRSRPAIAGAPDRESGRANSG